MPRRRPRSVAVGRWIGIALAALAIIAIVFTVLAVLFPEFRAISRDLAIIILAVFQLITAIITTVLLVVLVYAVQYLRSISQTTILPKVDLLTSKVDQVLDNTSAIANNVKNTASTVNTTTAYVAERTVAPLIRLSGLAVGVRAAASFLARRGAPPDSDEL
jgi:hypothetical protein